MANKRIKLDDANALPELSFDDDFNFDFEDPSDYKGPMRRFGVELGKEFSNQIFSTNTLKNLYRVLLPEGYVQTIGLTEKLWKEAVDLTSNVVRNSGEELRVISRKTEQLLPRVKRHIPNKAYEHLEKRLNQVKEHLDSSSPYSYQREQTRSERAEEEVSQLFAASSMAQTAELRNAELMANERYQKERIERNLKDVIDEKRWMVDSQRLDSITDSLGKLASYQDQILSVYHKKSLETSFKSYYVLKDIHNVLKASLQSQNAGFSYLVHNTSLPEHLKSMKAERRSLLDPRAWTPKELSSRLADGLPAYLDRFGGRVKENIQNRFKGGLGGVAEMLGMADMTDGMGIDGFTMAGMMAGNVGGGAVSNYIVPYLAHLYSSQLSGGGGTGSDTLDGLVQKFGPQVTEMMERGNASPERFSYMINNLQSVIRDYATDHDVEYGVMRNVRELIRDVLPSYYVDDSVEGTSFRDIDKPAQYTQLTNRTIVEVIPGLLSKQLRELRILNGSGDTGLEVFDFTKGEFVSEEKGRQRLLERIATKSERANVAYSLAEFFKVLDEDNSLSPEAREALAERVIRDASTGSRFDAKKWREGGYGRDVGDATLDELRGFFSERFDFDESGKMRGSRENWEAQNAISNQFLRLRMSLPDPREEIRRLTEAGMGDQLRSAGVIYTENGVDRINYEKLYQLYREDPDLDIEKERRDRGDRRSNLKRRFNKVKDVVNSFVPDREEGLTDIYTRDNLNSPRITAAGMIAGDYFDQETGEPITNLSDVKGTVINRAGEVVLDSSEIIKGIYDSNLNKIDDLNLLNKIKDKLSSDRPQVNMGGIKDSIVDSIRNELNKIEDIYVKGRKRPVLLARDIEAGLYTDLNTNKVIEGLEDITGTVVNSEGNVVLTEDDFRTGLVNVKGESLESSLGGRALRKYLDVTTSPARFIGKKLGQIVTKAVKSIFTDKAKDAYLPGNPDPILTVSKLKRGEYYNEDGTVIRSFNDVKGDVYNDDGLVLSLSDIPYLIDIDGKKHSIAKKPGILRKLAGLYWKGTKAYYRGLGRFTKWAGRKVFGKEAWTGRKEGEMSRADREQERLAQEYFSRRDITDQGYRGARKRPFGFKGDLTKDEKKELNETAQGGILLKIHDVLNKRLEPEGPRKGSWQDILQRRKEAATDDTDESTEDALDGPKGLAKLFSSIRGWFSRDKDDGEGGGGWFDVMMGKGGKGGKARGLAMVIPALKAIGIGAVAGGAGYGAFTYFSRQSDLDQPFMRLRLAQYGFSYRGFSQPTKVIEFEKMVEDSMRSGGEPDLRKLDLNKVRSLFKIEDDLGVANFASWWDNRFKPVYEAYRNALATHTDGISLQEMDTLLPKDLGLIVLESVIFPARGETPYNYNANPFGGEVELTIDYSFIHKRMEEVKDVYKGSAPVESDKIEFTSRNARSVERSYNAAESEKQEREWVDTQGRALPRFKAPSSSKAMSSSVAFLRRSDRVATSLQAIRLRGYGLGRLRNKDRNSLIQAEDEFFKKLSFRNGQAQFEGSHVEIAKEFGGLFGFKTDVFNDADTIRYLKWIEKRFIPMALAYAGAIHQVNPNSAIATGETNLTPVDKVMVARAMINAVYKGNGEDISVWDVTENIFGGSGMFARGSNKLLYDNAKVYLAALEQEADGYVIGEPKPFNDDGTEARDTRPTGIDAALAKPSVMTRQLTDIYSRSVDPLKGGPVGVLAPSTTQGGIVATPLTPDFNVKPTGALAGVKGAGTKGSFENVPFPKANKSRAAAIPTLSVVAQMTGVEVGLLVTFASIESNFDYNVKAKTSTATGWFQVVNPTWKELYRRHVNDYGLPIASGDATLQYRTEPRINSLLGAELLKENFNWVKKSLQRAPTDTDLYIMHFMGGPEGIKLLGTPGHLIAASLFPSAAGANRSVFYTQGGRAKTVHEIRQWADEKVRQHRYGTAADIAATPTLDHSGDPLELGQGSGVVDPGIDDKEFTEESEVVATSPESVSSQVDATASSLKNMNQMGIPKPGSLLLVDNQRTGTESEEEKARKKQELDRVYRSQAAAQARRQGSSSDTTTTPVSTTSQDKPVGVIDMDFKSLIQELSKPVGDEVLREQGAKSLDATNKQLETAEEMKGYLRIIAEKLTDGIDVKSAAVDGTQNNNQQGPRMGNRSLPQTPLPLSNR